MSAFEKLLVVIDPTRKLAMADQPALNRGVDLARNLGAELELFICNFNPHLSGGLLFDSPGLAKSRRSVIEHDEKRLERLAGEIGAEGITIKVAAAWDKPLHAGIVRHVLRTQPDLVIKDTHHHARLQRTLFTNTDWRLINTCPAPLLLVKTAVSLEESTLLAAVDPMNEHDKPAELDHKILALGAALEKSLSGRLHVFHGYAPIQAGAVSGGPEPFLLPVDASDEQIRETHRKALDELLARHPVAEERVHLEAGRITEELRAVVARLRARLVVMGAVARGGLKAVFIGSTAEQVLDSLPCDILVIKPDGFVCPLEI